MKSEPLPEWLIRAAEALPHRQRGTALGFAAGGWIAGLNFGADTTPETGDPVTPLATEAEATAPSDPLPDDPA